MSDFWEFGDGPTIEDVTRCVRRLNAPDAIQNSDAWADKWSGWAQPICFQVGA